MASFAELNADNEVIRVLKVADKMIADGRARDGESETKGIAYLKELLPDAVGSTTGSWVQCWCSVDGKAKYREVFPGPPSDNPPVLFIYDKTADVFYNKYGPPGFIFNEDTKIWSAPWEDDKPVFFWESDGGVEPHDKPEKPYPSWVWVANPDDHAGGRWNPPVPAPDNTNKGWKWVESIKNWVETVHAKN